MEKLFSIVNAILHLFGCIAIGASVPALIIAARIASK